MENTNSVAYIAKIKEITNIENAQNIQQAKTEGWTSIVQKGIHKEGDLILCITTDAVIPEELAIKWGVINYLRKGNRVKTVKLKGVYSECILIPLNDLEGIIKKEYLIEFLVEGKDCPALGIFKYEPPVITETLPGGKKIRFSQNPNFHIYYKFPNQKNVPNMFNEDDDVVITRKIHGINARYGIVQKTKLTFWDKIKRLFGNKWIEYEFVYGSYNVQKAPDSIGFYNSNVWHEILEKYDIENKLWKSFKNNHINGNSSFKNLIIYGEIFGPGIQGDKYSYNLKDKEIRFFDIEINGIYQNEILKESFFIDRLRLPIIEKLYEGKWSKEIQDKFVLNNYIEGTNIPHEGIVVSCITGDRNKISKVINPDYLMFSEKHLVPESH